MQKNILEKVLKTVLNKNKHDHVSLQTCVWMNPSKRHKVGSIQMQGNCRSPEIDQVVQKISDIPKLQIRLQYQESFHYCCRNISDTFHSSVSKQDGCWRSPVHLSYLFAPNLFRLSISLAFHTLPNMFIIGWCHKWSCMSQHLWPSSAISHVEFLSASCAIWHPPCFWRRFTLVLTGWQSQLPSGCAHQPLRTFPFS